MVPSEGTGSHRFPVAGEPVVGRGVQQAPLPTGTQYLFTKGGTSGREPVKPHFCCLFFGQIFAVGLSTGSLRGREQFGISLTFLGVDNPVPDHFINDLKDQRSLSRNFAAYLVFA